MACRVAGFRQASNHFFARFLWDGCEAEKLPLGRSAARADWEGATEVGTELNN